MREDIQKEIDKINSRDCVVLIKNGVIETLEHLDFGEVKVKFQDRKISYVDVTEKTQY